MAKQAHVGLVVWALVGALAALGCGDSTGGAEALEPGLKTSVKVSALEGGEVELGKVRATIPPGALEDDTEITVEVLDKTKQPKADRIKADVYDFGPDGTKFKKPVKLEFDVGDVKVPKGEKAVVAYLDGEEWVSLPDSKLAGGKVSATTTHFTPFTVLFVIAEDGTPVQLEGDCSAIDFVACGGDLVGTWEFTAACADFGDVDPFLDENGSSIFEDCRDTPSFSFTIDLEGTATFDADGSFEMNQTTTFMGHTSIPLSCIDTISGGTAEPEMLCTSGFEGKVEDDACVSVGEADRSTDMSTGTWTTADGRITIIEDDSSDPGSDEDDDAEYCVKGDTLTVRTSAGDGDEFVIYTATRR